MNHLAVDLGASGGKIFLGRIRGGEIVFSETHRFNNWPSQINGRYVWDVGRLKSEVVNGLKRAEEKFGEIDSLGIDSWGVDFGLISGRKLVRNPYSYRDPRLSSTLENIFEKVSKKEIFMFTGINHWNVVNSLCQYHYLHSRERKILHSADKILMIPQIISLMLGGNVCCEETIASTTQFLDPESRTWAKGLLKKLNLPTGKLPKIEKSGTKIGELSKGISSDINSRPDIVLPASHDTAAAVSGMPLQEDGKAFLSTGSWFIVGIELDEPLLSGEAFESGASNEVGVEGTSRFLKNINGFFLLEECRKEWRTRGQKYKYDEIMRDVPKGGPSGPLIDPDDKSFTIEGDMPKKIASYCRETGQDVPRGEIEITRCILESLAVKTAITLEDLIEVTDISSNKLLLGGGGAKNETFCQMLSSTLQIPVQTGPVEATAIGNILTQAKTYSEIENISEGRKLVEKSFEVQKYKAENHEGWNEAKTEMKELTEKR